MNKCRNCGDLRPGKVIKVDGRIMCVECKKEIVMRQNYYSETQKRWDTYFHNICKSIAKKSPCLSRKIGAILVRDKSIVSTGYNGPPRGIPHCGIERWPKDSHLRDIDKEINKTKSMANQILAQNFGVPTNFQVNCPRKVLGYKSGTHMELCPAQHAEQNTISNAARNGVLTVGTTLYINCVIPCKNCFGTLINAGIEEIVVEDVKVYDEHTQFLINNSSIKIRRFRE